MPMPPAYEDRAAAFYERYEAISAHDIQALLARWIPKGKPRPGARMRLGARRALHGRLGRLR